ncbi:hypothetical protein K8R42_04980 [bacterium]|nr:hypothetical protein [bacterium]
MPGSKSCLGDNRYITEGRQNAIKTDAAAFIPIVLVKISTQKPRKKAKISNNHFGVSKGNNKINKTYKYGLT